MAITYNGTWMLHVSAAKCERAEWSFFFVVYSWGILSVHVPAKHGTWDRTNLDPMQPGKSCAPIYCCVPVRSTKTCKPVFFLKYVIVPLALHTK